ncbi:MAG: DUF222 domain-containing protein [Jiangellaceae bacterium]
MFERAATGVLADYAFTAPLPPGAVDPVRLAVLLEGSDAGHELLDPEEFALFGPDPDADTTGVPASLDHLSGAVAPSTPPEARTVPNGVAEPAVLVPTTVPDLEDMSPGSALARVLETVDTSRLGAYELVEAVAGFQRLMSWAAAGQAAAIAELSRRTEMHPVEDDRKMQSLSPQRLTGMEVAARLRLAPAAGEGLVSRSLCLVQTLPVTHAALAAGRIDARRADVIADELRRHKPEVAQLVDAEVAGKAEILTAPRLRRAVQKAVHRLVPVTVEQRREDAVARRQVSCTPAGDGMAWMEAFLPVEDAAALMNAIEAAAAAAKRTCAGDERTLGQRRADALAAMGWTALRTGRLGGCDCGPRLDDLHGRPVSVLVTVAATTLLGLDDLPGELAGFGPIPAEVARRLAADGTWQRLLTDPASGVVLDYGRTRYEPPADLVEHVNARDQTCRWPGCERPAERCECDHSEPYPLGPTAAGNLGALCKAHHLVKHRSRWRVRQPEPGRFTWTSATGHIYVEETEPVAEPGPPRPPPASKPELDVPPF